MASLENRVSVLLWIASEVIDDESHLLHTPILAMLRNPQAHMEGPHTEDRFGRVRGYLRRRYSLLYSLFLYTHEFGVWFNGGCE